MKFVIFFILGILSVRASAQDLSPATAEDYDSDPAGQVLPGRPQLPTHPKKELIEKIISHGVPRRGVEKLFDFRDRYLGATFVTDIYQCAGQKPGDARGCGERDRIYTTQSHVITDHPYAIYIDYKIPSRLKRLWLINMKTGETEFKLVAHGAGSGRGPDVQRFSNRRDSRMTSLGMYVAGESYKSNNHGIVLRMHGLEKSNSNAYVRDIIFHGARYVSDDYLQRKIEKVGESWGCPAVDQAFADRIIPLLRNGALILLDHEDLLESSLSGEEVALPPPR